MRVKGVIELALARKCLLLIVSEIQNHLLWFFYSTPYSCFNCSLHVMWQLEHIFRFISSSVTEKLEDLVKLCFMNIMKTVTAASVSQYEFLELC